MLNNDFIQLKISQYFCFNISLAIPSVKDPEFSASWIYDYLGEQFSSWLPDEAKVTFDESGFYTYKLLPGLRIVSLNSILNLGYNLYVRFVYFPTYSQITSAKYYDIDRHIFVSA